MIFVTVLGPRARLVYVDGVYDEVAGKTPMSLILPAGIHLIETVNGRRQVDYRHETDDLPGGSLVTVTLAAVNPPEPI